MIIYVDIDGTICKTKGMHYKKSKPRKRKIKKVNKLYNKGHHIVYWTARGTGSGTDWSDVTLSQLLKWKAKFHELKFDKPVYDIFYCDKAGKI